MLVYPENDLDVIDKVKALLGGYWSDVYAESDQIDHLVAARSTLWKESNSSWVEAGKSKSRHDISPLKPKSWLYFPIKRSEGVSPKGFYEGGGAYGTSLLYGRTPGLTWRLPPGVLGASQIYNRITYPSVSLFEGIDYSIDPKLGLIQFKENPFNNPGIAYSESALDDLTTDREIALWIHNAKLDQQSMQLIFGLPIGVDGRSNEEYKRLINTIYDCLILGTSSGRLASLLGYALNVPVALATETVELINTEARKIIVTDKNVYFMPYRANAAVLVGDTVIKGSSLSDALTIKELRRGVDLSGVAALTLGKGFIANKFVYDLTFLNEDLDTLIADSDGVTELKFKVNGHPLDVDHFWETTHKNGVDKGRTLAQALDIRNEKIGEPQAESLPSTVNPMRFLLENIVPMGLTLITIKAEALPQAIPRMDVVPDLLPMGNGVLFIFEAPLAIDSTFEVQSSDEGTFTAIDTIVSYGSLGMLNLAVSIKTITSQCS